MSYVVSHPEVHLALKLEEIAKLHVHEETIEEIVDALRREWETTSTIRHPIMVDENTHVILDGTHRLQTLKQMGCNLIPACLVDYANPSIEVKNWVRIASTASGTMRNLPRNLNDWGYRFKKVPAATLTQQLRRREAIGMKLREDSYVLPQRRESIEDIYATVKALERDFKSNGYRVRYAGSHAQPRKQGYAAIIPPRVTKHDVLTVALRGDVFTHKSTRHMFPARTLSVNVPVEWLCLPVDKANRLFLRILSTKRCTYVRRPQAEDLYLFQ